MCHSDEPVVIMVRRRRLSVWKWAKTAQFILYTGRRWCCRLRFHLNEMTSLVFAKSVLLQRQSETFSHFMDFAVEWCSPLWPRHNVCLRPWCWEETAEVSSPAARHRLLLQQDSRHTFVTSWLVEVAERLDDPRVMFSPEPWQTGGWRLLVCC